MYPAGAHRSCLLRRDRRSVPQGPVSADERWESSRQRSMMSCCPCGARKDSDFTTSHGVHVEGAASGPPAPRRGLARRIPPVGQVAPLSAGATTARGGAGSHARVPDLPLLPRGELLYSEPGFAELAVARRSRRQVTGLLSCVEPGPVGSPASTASSTVVTHQNPPHMHTAASGREKHRR